MIPLNAAEAAELLKHRETEFRRGLQQIQYFGAMEALWRRRNNRVAAEMDALQAQVAAAPQPPAIGNLEGEGHHG